MRMGIVLLALAACNDTAPMQMQGDAPGSGSGSNVIHDAPMADVPGGVGEPAELMGMTLYHNQVRAMVVTTPALEPMQWDPNLAAYAAAWVAQCQDTQAPIGLVDHDPNRTNVAGYAYIGENIFASGGTATAQQAVQTWASEQANYTYSTNTCNGVCGHYTQIVWRDSLHVGCALHNCPGLTYPSTIVCDYGPGGNIGNQQPY